MAEAKVDQSELTRVLLDEAAQRASAIGNEVRKLRFYTEGPKYALVLLGSSATLLTQLPLPSGAPSTITFSTIAFVTTVVAFLDSKDFGANLAVIEHLHHRIRYFVEQGRLLHTSEVAKHGGVRPELPAALLQEYLQIRSDYRAFF